MKYDFVDAEKPVKVKKFDAESAVAFMKQLFEKQIVTMQKKADKFQVTDEKSIAMASEMATQAKKLFSTVEKKRKEIKAPYLAFTKTLDEIARNVKSPLLEIQKLLEGKIAPVALAIQEKKEAELKAAAEKAEKDTIKTPVIAAPSVVASDGKIKAQTGTVKVEKVLKWDLVDFAKVPSTYKVTELDFHKIDEAVKSGAKIAGIRVYEDSKTTTRLNR